MGYEKLTDEYLDLLLFNAKVFVNVFNRISGKGEERVLLYLWKKDGGVLSGELARKLCLSTGRMANILKALEKKKYIYRACKSEDRRKVSVFLTEKGKHYIEKLYRKICNEHKEVFEYLGEKDATDMVRIFKKIIAFQKRNNSL